MSTLDTLNRPQAEAALLAAAKALLKCRWVAETVSAEVDALRDAVATIDNFLKQK